MSKQSKTDKILKHTFKRLEVIIAEKKQRRQPDEAGWKKEKPEHLEASLSSR